MKFKLLMINVFISILCTNAQKVEYEKMIFPVWNPDLEFYGCVNIHGDTIISSKYNFFYSQTFLPFDGNFIIETRNEEARMKVWTLGWSLFYGVDDKKIFAYHYDKPFNRGNIIMYCCDDYLIYESNGKQGCIDVNGKEILPCKFDEILANPYNDWQLFNKGYANVIKDGHYSIVKNNGDVFISNVNYDYLANDSCLTSFIVHNEENKYGVCDKNGVLVYPCIANSINYSPSTQLYLVNKEDTYGCINERGDIIVPFDKYTDMEDLYNGLICVGINYKFGCIDKTGKLVIPLISGYILNFNDNDLAPFSTVNGKVTGEPDHFGYIDQEGNIVIPCIYSYAYDFKGDYALVCTGSDPDDLYSDSWCCINKKGEVVKSNINQREFYLSPNGYYCEKNKYGYNFKKIEGTTPNSLLQCWFESPAYFNSKGIAIIERNGMKWFINEYGQNILNNKFDEVGTLKHIFFVVSGFSDYNDDLWLVTKNGFQGVVDLEHKKIVIPCKYDEIEYNEGVNHGMVKVKIHNKYGYVDLKTGEEIIPCKYSFLTSRLKKFQYLYENNSERLSDKNKYR